MCQWRRHGLGGKSRHRPPNQALGEDAAAWDSSDGGEDLLETKKPDQATADPGHFLARFNCAAAVSLVDEPHRNRLKRYEFAVEACLGPACFHRSKVRLRN